MNPEIPRGINTPEKTQFLTGRSYDFLKSAAQIYLPGIASLYFALAQIWGLPKAEEVVGTITAVDLFLGLLLGQSSKAYNNSDARFDGSIDVTEVDEKKMFSLNLDSDPNDLSEKDQVVFKVNK